MIIYSLRPVSIHSNSAEQKKKKCNDPFYCKQPMQGFRTVGDKAEKLMIIKTADTLYFCLKMSKMRTL